MGETERERERVGETDKGGETQRYRERQRMRKKATKEDNER